jgi:anti-sigma B factor antagonist
MLLRLESRPVGEVMLIQCYGRIIAGNEVFTLHAKVADAIEKYGDVVLQLDQVEFLDSSGLGALMRLVQMARSKAGDLKLTGVPEKIRKVLQLTNLLAQFEVYDSIEEAITAAYLGSRYSRGKTGDVRPCILGVYASTDICTFLREVLCAAGYNALTTTSMDDAQILLKATKAKLVVVSSRMQSVRGTPIRAALDDIDPAVALFVLRENFATDDPGDAAEVLLTGVAGLLAAVPS